MFFPDFILQWIYFQCNIKQSPGPPACLKNPNQAFLFVLQASSHAPWWEYVTNKATLFSFVKICLSSVSADIEWNPQGVRLSWRGGGCQYWSLALQLTTENNDRDAHWTLDIGQGTSQNKLNCWIKTQSKNRDNKKFEIHIILVWFNEVTLFTNCYTNTYKKLDGLGPVDKRPSPN